MQKEALYRTSAVVYAEGNMESRKTKTIRRKFVEAVFVNSKNCLFTVSEIGVKVYEELDIMLTDNEINEIVSDSDFFVLHEGKKKEKKYSLHAERYSHLQEKSEDNIEKVVNRYLEDCNGDVSDSDELRSLLDKYLFAMMNSNIVAYKQVLAPSSAQKSSGRVDIGDFSEDEIQTINQFLSWNDSAKDKELFKLVSCCIEYAIAVNNSKENALIEAFKNKVFYLDNALIYRAIGINGDIRKKRTLSFIRKCKECGQELRISKYSCDEFHDTIDYHLSQLNKTTPFGKINPTIFRKRANGEGFYQFYHEWRGDRVNYSFDIFQNFILSEYNSLLKMYGIKEDYDIPFDDHDVIPEIGRYTDEIKAIKIRGHHKLHVSDARNMYWIECKRAGKDGRMSDTKFYFVTSDQKLQAWDYSHSHNQPLTLLPSQWMALLLKYYSRTNDDYKSFVSFMKIPHDDSDLSADELQEILSGISQITEDFKNQNIIVDTFLETDWRRQCRKDTTRHQAKEFAKEKLEEQFAERLLEKEKEHGKKLFQVQAENMVQLDIIRDEFRNQLALVEQKSKREQLSMITQQLQDMQQQKDRIDDAVNSDVKHIQWIAISFVVFMIGLWFLYGLFISTPTMLVVCFIVSLLVIAPLIIFKTISYKKIESIARARRNKHYNTLYNYSDSRFNELKNISEKLTEDLKDK